MATLTRGQTFGATETVTNTKLHNLIDNATITNIVDADIAPGANIQFSKLLASSIDASLLVNLGNIGSGAGTIPFVNLPLPLGATYVSLVSIPNASLLPLTLASWVDGVALRNLASTPVDQQVRYNLLVSSLASGGIPRYDGANNFVGSSAPLSQASVAYSTGFGAWASATLNASTLATTDGILVVFSTGGTCEIRTDGSNPPTTKRANIGGNGQSATCPVRSGDYYLITDNSNLTGFWLPIS